MSICEDSNYLKRVIHDSKIVCNEIIYVMNVVSSNLSNTITTNLSTNSVAKKVIYKTDCYILDTGLLVIILLLIIGITCYHYAKYRSKLKTKLPC